ncbi:MAG: hypothetical protein R3E95_10015 [Thiolinea sp.]
MWEDILDRFVSMSTRQDPGDASLELIVILAVAFILGFLFCYVQGKSND